MSTAAKLADINIIADQKFAPPRLCQVRGDGMAAWPSQVPGKMLHLQRTESSKAGKKEQTLFAESVFTNYLKWILADKNMAVSRNF